MSDYDDYDFGGSEDDPQKPRGLTREAVDQIRWAVLGMEMSGNKNPPPISAPVGDDIANPQGARGSDGRFEPGHSGNEAGRPRKQFTAQSIPANEVVQDILAAMVQQALARELTVTRDGVTHQRTVREIVFELQLAKALKGSTTAARLVEGMHRWAKNLAAERRARDYATWKDRKARYTAIHERSKRRGLELDWSCPHPDDIILGPGHDVKIVGPMTPEELVRTHQIYQRATYWLIVSVYETWLQKRRMRSHRHCPHIHADVVSCYIFQAEQHLIPPRLRMATTEIEDAVLKLNQTAGRVLHDVLRAEAHKVGMPVPPRALRIPFTLAHPLSEDLVPEVPQSDQPDGADVVRQDTSAAGVFKLAWAELMKTQEAEG